MSDSTNNERLILVVNSGSSSIKYKVFSFPSEAVVLHGEVVGIGSNQGQHVIHLVTRAGQTLSIEEDPVDFPTHNDGFKAVLATLSRFHDLLGAVEISAIGHRVVHGGDEFISPALINDTMLAKLERLNRIAPLHNPDNLLGIKICCEAFPNIPQVAVFDTAYHQTIPEYAYRYAIPQEWYQEYKIRRYGFHGCSHQYVSQQAARLLHRPLDQLNLLSLHLGNGASICAVKQGKSVDTSMGFTPLEGLIMGSRSGDIDASIPLYLQNMCGLTDDEIEQSLNTESGLKALAGTNDVSRLLEQEKAGDHSAKLALDAYIYRIRKYVGAYLVTLGHIDAIIFTAGIGENVPEIRDRCCKDLEMFGIQLDPTLNVQQIEQNAIIDSSGTTRIMVIRTNEELQIAHETRQIASP